MVLEKKGKVGEYEIIKEGDEEIIKINAENWSFPASIEDSELAMAQVIDYLTEKPSANQVILTQRKNYIYGPDQTLMLSEIATIYNVFIKQKKVLSLQALGLTPNSIGSEKERFDLIQYIVLTLIKSDPLGAYVELRRLLREEKIKLEKTSKSQKDSRMMYITTLEFMINTLDKTELVKIVKSDLPGYNLGDRTLYKQIFRPSISPDFLMTKLMATPPLDGEQLDIYEIDEDTEVTIFKRPGDIKTLYFISPPEFKISEDKYTLLDLGRAVLAEHKPREEEFLDPEKMRVTFLNIGKDLLTEIAQNRGIDVSYDEVVELAEMLVRYTVGFGLIEVLLKDEHIQDITLNGPVGETPIFIVHAIYGDCVTNIIPSREDAESWASKFRLISGRPLDEANPVLDTELDLPDARARAAIVTSPLNPHGLAFAFRRHRDKPWTFALFVNNGMMNAMAAGLLSFLIDSGRSIIFGGTRSSGKTSLLGSALIELMRRHRVLTIEDTLELPGRAMRHLGFNIQQMKVRSALTQGGTEMGAEEGIRTALRMGDSALIVGEIRSQEAKALYEAMRIGALANVVAGTIHGDSPYGVFDRVVNDLEVPTTSFKATDIIVISNPIRTPDGLHSVRRVLSITEVRKHWTKDPNQEMGFVDLMRYNPETDDLEPTDDLINGNSEILKSAASNVKEWAGDWDSVWDNIMVRAKTKELLVDYAKRSNKMHLLESDFVVRANDMYHIINESVKEEKGFLDSKSILLHWEAWLKREIRK